MIRPRSGAETPAIMRRVNDFPAPRGPQESDGPNGSFKMYIQGEVFEVPGDFHMQRPSRFQGCFRW